MNTGPNMAQVAALIGDPGRANMLAAMFGGARSAGDLALIAGVSPATASGHLAKLVEGRLVSVETRGRQRYFRLASAEVARALEAITVLAADTPEPARATPRVPQHLRAARVCYDHLAGRLGVALAEGLARKGAVVLTPDAGAVTLLGSALFAELGVVLEPPKGSRRPLCRPCLDWSERRPHLAGLLGARLMTRMLELSWLERRVEHRAIALTTAGHEGLVGLIGAEAARSVSGTSSGA
jgi:DNA-binding transcriptional ArsR family regulator